MRKKCAYALIGATGVTGEGAHLKTRRGNPGRTTSDVKDRLNLHELYMGINNHIEAGMVVGAARSSDEVDVMFMEQRGCT